MLSSCLETGDINILVQVGADDDDDITVFLSIMPIENEELR